jgi:hypothetical protein
MRKLLRALTALALAGGVAATATLTAAPAHTCDGPCN